MSRDDSTFPWREAEKDLIAGIDTSVPHSARIWNYWMGGKDNYPIDQQVGDEFAAIYPGIVDMARVSRYFIARIVRYLAGEAGIRQFLDIGTGLPSHDNTHEVARRIILNSRTVYVDNDPLVLAHARALLTSDPTSAGTTDYIDADLNQPDTILQIARVKLDFTQPLAILLMGVLGHIPITNGDNTARSIVDRLKDALPPGGYLAVYDGTNTDPAYVEAIRQYNEGGSVPYHLRTPDQITSFLNGLELIDPGVVPVQQWRPEHNPLGPTTTIDAWGGLAKKPST